MATTSQSNPASAIPVYVVGASGVAPGATSLGYQQITALTSATGLTSPAGAHVAVISVSGQPVRYRDDGVAPTATVGMPLPVGTVFSYAASLATIQFIQTAATATLDVNYY